MSIQARQNQDGVRVRDDNSFAGVAKVAYSAILCHMQT